MAQHTSKQTWDNRYASLPLSEPDQSAEIGAEFCRLVSELLPNGGKVLEAGCGGGIQSLALAGTGNFDVTLGDSSPEVLSQARQLFEREKVPGRFEEMDVRAPGAGQFDLVFNLGVLDYYGSDEQAAFVRGMASRSRRFVLALVPNRLCYWYWLWRIEQTKKGEWAWGEEAPERSLAAVFKAAGVTLSGERYVGQTWTETFIRDLPGLTPSVAGEIIEIHRSAVVPSEQAAFLLAALGSVEPSASPHAGWLMPSGQDNSGTGEWAAAAANSLALRIAADAEVARYKSRLAEIEASFGNRAPDAAAAEKRALIATVDALAQQLTELSSLHQSDLARTEDSFYRCVIALTDALKADPSELPTYSRPASFDGLIEHIHAAGRNLERVEQEQLQYKAENERLERQLSEDKANLERLDREQHQYKAEVERLKEQLSQDRVNIERLEKEVRQDKAEIANLSSVQARLEAENDLANSRTETLRNETLAGLHAFSVRFGEKVALYRSQRAWRIMVAVRRAYALTLQLSWRAKLGLLLSLIGVRPQVSSDWRPDEITFPDVWGFLPATLSSSSEQTVAAGPAGSAGAPQEQVTVYKYDVIILPIFDFEFRFQRPQQLATQFARAGHRVFWVSPTRPAGDSREIFEAIPLREGLWELRLPTMPVDIYRESIGPARIEQWLSAFNALWRAYAVAEACVIVQFPSWRSLALGLRRQYGVRIVYDCMDDWQNWHTEPRPSDFSVAEERSLAEECDVLAVTSAELAGRYAGHEPPPLLLRNGADFQHFQAPPATRMIPAVSQPVIGYFGAISSWFDVHLIAEVASMRPNYSFVFIGQVHERDVSPLNLPNVRLLGEKHYRELPGHLNGFDVCMIPFVRNRLTEAVDPVKVYEYFSQGKPVVSTLLPELARCEDLVYMAGDSVEFAACLDVAVAERDETLRRRRQDFARENQWQNRYAALNAAISSSFPLVSILVVTYNSLEFVNPFLDSIAANTSYPNYEVAIVDNDSRDGTPELIAKRASENPRIRFVRCEENRGFAAGNNIAAKTARGDILVLLNVDTFVSPGWIERLLRPARQDETIGMAAPVTNFSGNETRIDVAYRNAAELEKFTHALARQRFGMTMELETAPLLCALVSRRIWEEVGGLDERFETGMFEDDDFSLRMRQKGYRIVTAEDCFIHHFGNGSFAKLPEGESLRVFEENRNRFEQKWNLRWKPHKSRAGAAPLADLQRIPVGAFAVNGRPRDRLPHRVVLVGLHPPAALIGEAVNVQPNGSSALVVDCENASPSAVIKFGDVFLPTSFGTPRHLSALLPDGFASRAREVPVMLVDDFGVSNAIVFRVGAGSTTG